VALSPSYTLTLNLKLSSVVRAENSMLSAPSAVRPLLSPVALASKSSTLPVPSVGV